METAIHGPVKSVSMVLVRSYVQVEAGHRTTLLPPSENGGITLAPQVPTNHIYLPKICSIITITHIPSSKLLGTWTLRKLT